MIARIAASLLLSSLALSAQAQAPEQSVTVFENVRIFDGKSGQLSSPSYVLVRGNLIERISTTPIPTDRRADTVLVDGGGRTLMPGLIDMHWHTMLVRPTPAQAHGGRSRLLQPGRRRRSERDAACAASRPFATWAGRPSASSGRSTRASSSARASTRPAP